MKLKTFACFCLIVLVTSFVSAQPSPSSAPSLRSPFLVDWAQFNFDAAHDGYNPYETILSPANVGSVTLKWSYTQLESPVQGQPAIANGVAYVVAGSTIGESGAVYAFNAGTGALIWKFAPGLLLGPPAVANGVVYVSTGYVYALDANTGAPIWESRNDSYGVSTTVVNNIVYVSGTNDVEALDAGTGTLIWEHPLSASLPFAASPTVANGVVYVITQDGILSALNAGTGALIWSRNFSVSPTPQPTLYKTYGGLSVANGVLYVEAADPTSRHDAYNVWALNPNTGARIWRSPNIATAYFASTPAVAKGVLYVGAYVNTSGYVYALSTGTGALIWQYQLENNLQSPTEVGSPIVANGVVYVGSWISGGEGTAYYTITALDATAGAFLWNTTELQGGLDVLATPSVVNGTIYGTITQGEFGAFALPNQ